MAEAHYQSLYRRYRPQRFSEIRGQDHVTRALRNEVRDTKVSHAYLFSGPRGTGKTSAARVLAKALNCTALSEGEPCGACPSCVAAEAGNLLDVFELDAASNRGIDAMRDLIGGVALGTSGRRKVYIVDEVHMLSREASTALLKTLEEPPEHVVFVLATTDPQKVLPTIRSRTQHFEFRLMASDVLAGLVRDINADAGLGIDDAAIERVVRRGHGSARDALSVLEQVSAGGEADAELDVGDALLEALCERDAGGALLAVAEGCAAGRDPRVLATELLDRLRNAFLSTLAPALMEMTGAARDRVTDQAQRMGPAAIVRSLDVIGQAVADMREALDPRLSLEVAVVRAARADSDTGIEALLERIERLERGQHRATQGSEPVPDASRPGPPPPGPTRAAPSPPAPLSSAAPAPPAVPAAASPPSTAMPASGPLPTPAGELPSRDELTKAWGDAVLAALPPAARVRFRAGRFLAVEDGVALFALPNQPHREMTEPHRGAAEQALTAHFGVPVKLRLVVEPDSDAPPLTEPDDEPIERSELVDATDVEVTSPAERLKQAFPGAQEVTS